jgi:hypothetical protein
MTRDKKKHLKPHQNPIGDINDGTFSASCHNTAWIGSEGLSMPFVPLVPSKYRLSRAHEALCRLVFQKVFYKNFSFKTFSETRGLRGSRGSRGEVRMAMPPFADPANLVAREVEVEEDGPEGETSLQLLQTVYRDRKQPLNVRVRCAVEALQHEYGKVSAVKGSKENLADALDRELQALARAVARSRQPTPLPPPKTIEHEPPPVSPSEMKKPFSRYRRY